MNELVNNCKPLVRFIKTVTYPTIYIHECCHYYTAKLVGIEIEGDIVMHQESKSGLVSYVKLNYDVDLPNKPRLQKSRYLFKMSLVSLAPTVLTALTFWLLHLNIINIPLAGLLLAGGFLPSISDFVKGFVYLVASVIFLFNNNFVKIVSVED